MQCVGYGDGLILFIHFTPFFLCFFTGHLYNVFISTCNAIFIGSRVSDKYPCPLISMGPEQQIVVAGGRQQYKWEFHWQRLTFKVSTIREHKRPSKKHKNKAVKVNENG